MTYVIGESCIGEMDGSCVDVCPVDCIYEGEEKRYINPVECIDCGACLTVCPVLAITAPQDGHDPVWERDNAVFFDLTLPGRSRADRRPRRRLDPRHDRRGHAARHRDGPRARERFGHQIDDVVAACAALAAAGLGDMIWGHPSVRDSDGPRRLDEGRRLRIR